MASLNHLNIRVHLSNLQELQIGDTFIDVRELEHMVNEGDYPKLLVKQQGKKGNRHTFEVALDGKPKEVVLTAAEDDGKERYIKLTNQPKKK